MTLRKKLAIIKKISMFCMLFCHFLTSASDKHFLANVGDKQERDLFLNVPFEIVNHIASYYIDSLSLSKNGVSLCVANQFFYASCFGYKGEPSTIQYYALAKRVRRELFGFIRVTSYDNSLARTFMLGGILDAKKTSGLAQQFCDRVNNYHLGLVKQWNTLIDGNKENMRIEQSSHLITFCHTTGCFVYRSYRPRCFIYKVYRPDLSDCKPDAHNEEIVKFFSANFSLSALKNDPLVNTFCQNDVLSRIHTLLPDDSSEEK